MIQSLRPALRRILASAWLLALVGGSALPALAQRGGGQQMTPEQRAQFMRGEVTGRVLAGDTGDPITSATVALWLARDSSLVTGAITDADGTFALSELRPGRFYLRVSFVGFASQTISDITLSPREWTAALGDITLETDAEQMGEVVVEGEREQVEIALDRTIYNVKDQPTLAGASGTDVLEQIPSVELDIDGNISLRGSQNVAVLINGRPSQLSGDQLTAYLSSLSSDVIDRVEVIPNPSARYEPDGMSGILNIVLKQDAEIGLSGGLSLSASTQNNFNASSNLGVGRGPINLRLNGGVRYNERPIIGTLDQEFFEIGTSDNLGRFRDQVEDGARVRASVQGGFDLDYRLSEMNTITLSGRSSYRDSDNDSFTAITALRSDGGLFDDLTRLEDDQGSSIDVDGTLAFRRVIEPTEHELTAEVRLNAEWEEDTEVFRETDIMTTPNLLRETQDVLENENQLNGSAQIDYARPLAGMRLETGAKADYRRLDTDLDAVTREGGQVLTASQVLATVFDEQIYAAYGILTGERGKFSAQAGFRAEQALTTLDLDEARSQDSITRDTSSTTSNDYFNIFPSVFVQFKPTQTQSIKASYSKRINRPRTRALNPIPSFGDTLNVRVGNPNLKPEFTHAFELSYTRFSRSSSVTLTPFYRYTTDVITRFTDFREGGVQVFTFENLDTSDSYGLESIITYRMGRALNAFVSANGYRVVTDGSNVEDDLGNDGAWGWSMRGNLTLNVREGTSMQAFAFYRAPMDLEQGRIGAFSSVTIGVSQKLLQDRATLTLRASDVFDTMQFNLVQENTRTLLDRTRRWGARDVQLSFTYSFGKQERRRERNREGGEGGGFDEMDMDE